MRNVMITGTKRATGVEKRTEIKIARKQNLYNI